MATPPVKAEISDPFPKPSNATMRIGMGKFWDYATGLLGMTGNAPEARAALGVGLTSRVKGLRGNVNATTPLTKFDLSADEVVLVDANGATYRDTNTGTLTVDLGLAGSVANGRDQSGAFAANSWIHLYRIWNGTTRALIASLSATAPTLPAGYTHWCYASSIRWNASSNIIPVLVRGAVVHYDIADAGVNRVLSAGVATAMTTVDCSGFIPPNAPRGRFKFAIVASNTVANSIQLFIRSLGSTQAGELVCRAFWQAASTTVNVINFMDYPMVSSSIQYKMSGTPDISGGAYIDVAGYVVPNGDC